jgi:lipopolysaccharide biosynthesis protein
MADDLYTLIGYQVEATADWRRRQAEYFPHDDRNARVREPRKSLSGLLWKLINWKARQSTNRFASRLTV